MDLLSGSAQQFGRVGFSPTAATATTLIRKASRSYLNNQQQRCFSSLNTYNSDNSLFALDAQSLERRRASRRFMPYDIKKPSEALFGPIPTMASSIVYNTPVMKEDVGEILDDDMVFQELDWMINNNDNNNLLPPSPPLSPLYQSNDNNNDELLNDDFILFP